jgi:ribosomal protein S12 methylthiotransferase accessory factor
MNRDVRARRIELMASPKVNANGTHRTVAAHKTWRRLRPLLPRIGITRVADITGLDRVGIPTFSCVRPVSYRSGVTVTCGKGRRAVDAMVGAIMESIEYKLCEPFESAHRIRTCRRDELDGLALDPRELVVPPWLKDPDALRFEWVEGWDIVHDEAIWVPAASVFCPFEAARGAASHLFHGSTNGLASGNCYEEAICHGLSEVIERDALSIYQSAFSAAGEQFPLVDPQTVPASCQELLARFHKADVEVWIRNVTSDLGIPTFDVNVLEDHGAKFLFHNGTGTHLIAEIALWRAITEAAQSRAADIQGSREDLSHWRRGAMQVLDRNAVVFRDTGRVKFGEIPSYKHGDVRDDIRFMCERLRERGMSRVIVVDLTCEEIGVPCVKVIVPGADQSFVDRWRVGPRVRKWIKSGEERAS